MLGLYHGSHGNGESNENNLWIDNIAYRYNYISNDNLFIFQYNIDN